MKDADVIIIGGGPGGYVCALKLAILGKSVLLVERDRLGGTCLNRGCIPTKALLHSAGLYARMKSDAAGMGVIAESISLDTAQVNAYKQKTVDSLVRGVQGLLKARGVQVVKGEAAFVSPHEVSVTLPDGKAQRLSAPHIVIATGSRAAIPKIPGIEGRGVITSTEALDVAGLRLPGSLAVIGGGVIGVEIGSAYAGFGVEVSIVEAMPGLLPGIDGEVVAGFTLQAEKKMRIDTGAFVKEIADAEGGQKRVVYERGGEEKELRVDKVLAAVGRVADIGGLGLDKAGVITEKNHVAVDGGFRTNVEGVYCIGDANAICMLAHAASAQGMAVAGQIAGKRSGVAQGIVPACVYAEPEIAAVGLTEEQAKEEGIDYKTAKFPFRANGRSLVLGQGEGFVKILAGAKYGEVLGVHMTGPHVTELIAECALAIKLEACVEDIANTIHAHPTVSESIMEAAECWLGEGIHFI